MCFIINWEIALIEWGKPMILPECQKPILAMEKVNQSSECTLIFITSIDKHVYEIRVTQADQTIDTWFQLEESPCTCLFYYSPTRSRPIAGMIQPKENLIKQQNSDRNLMLGCSNGSVLKYNLNDKKLYKQKFHNINSSDDVVCVYVRGDKVFSWTISSQTIILDEATMQHLRTLKWQVDICSIIHISGSHLRNSSACVAFNGHPDPFVFDSDNPKQLQIAYIKTKKFQSEQQDAEDEKSKKVQDEEIYLLTTNGQGKVVAAQRSKLEARQQYFIIIYQIEKEGNLDICGPRQKIKVGELPTYLDIYSQFIFICRWQDNTLFNLNTRKLVPTTKTKKIRCILILLVNQKHRTKIIKTLVSKMFSGLHEQSYEKNRHSIKIEQFRLPSKVV